MFVRFSPNQTVWPLLMDYCMLTYFVFTEDDFEEKDDVYKEFLTVMGTVMDECIGNFKRTKILRIHVAFKSSDVEVVASSEAIKHTEALQGALRDFIYSMRQEFEKTKEKDANMTWNNYLRAQLLSGGLVLSFCNILDCAAVVEDGHDMEGQARKVFELRRTIIECKK